MRDGAAELDEEEHGGERRWEGADDKSRCVEVRNEKAGDEADKLTRDA